MGFNRRFAARLAVRLGLFALATFAFVWVVDAGGLPTTAIVVAGLMLWSGVAVWSLASRTNVELARFVAALDQRDFVQTFARAGRGSGFDELGRAFDGAIRSLRSARAEGMADNRFAGALVDGAPTPLLAIDGQGRIEMANKAARRLFAGVAGVRIDDYAPFGAEFVEALRATPAGRRSTRLLIDGLPQRAMLSVTTVDRGGTLWRIAAIQVIQHELDQAEVAAQADLVRVLTHEIMNSITPVTSLAASAARLVATIDDGRDPAIGDVRAAIETLARRAEETMHFVESYREFARTPAVTIAPFDGRRWADELARLFAASPVSAGVRLMLETDADLVIHADIALLTQTTLNLLKNAAEASSTHAHPPLVRLSVGSMANGRTKIAVSDNGPGIPRPVRTGHLPPLLHDQARWHRRRPELRATGSAPPRRRDRRAADRGGGAAGADRIAIGTA